MLSILNLFLELLIPVSFFTSLVYAIKIISDNRVRRKLIEKGIIPQDLNYLFGKKYDFQFPSPLRLGKSRIFMGS